MKNLIIFGTGVGIGIITGIWIERGCWMEIWTAIGILAGMLTVRWLCIDTSIGKCFIKKDITATITGIILALISINISVFDDVYSQYDYSYDKIIDKIYLKNYNTDFAGINNNDSTEKEIVFLLDVSGSAQKKFGNSGKDNSNKNIVQIRNKIRETGWLPATGEKDHNLLCLRLFFLLQDIRDNNNTANMTYSIITFANNAETVYTKKKFSDEILKETYNRITNITFKGENTDFLSLLQHIDTKISNTSDDSNYKPKECILVFLTDYVHDTKYDTDKNSINDIIKKWAKTNTFSKLFTLKEISDEKIGDFSVYDLFHKNIPEFKKESIDLRQFDNGILFEQLSKQYFPFYYSSQLYNEKLVSNMTFKNIKENINNDFMFSLPPSSSLYQEFYLKKDDRPQILNETPIPVHINNNSKLEFTMTGFIPSPDTHYELIIKDANKVQYRIPIVFFKELSNFSKYSLLVWFGMLFGMLIGILLEILPYRKP
jgi:hypothetical protein